VTTTTGTRYEIDVKDVEYLRHGDKPLLARIYQPRGAGPFPVIIDLHGGAWTKKDRTSDVATCEGLARAGIVAVALDFRMPPQAKYPASIADVNYAVRWCKTRATELKSRPDMVGILGVSSGGQQAMISAMRPADPRYAALPGKAGVDASFDAAVRCVVLCWPVIDPLGRYEYAKQKIAAGDAKQAQADERARADQDAEPYRVEHEDEVVPEDRLGLTDPDAETGLLDGIEEFGDGHWRGGLAPGVRGRTPG